jgi:hypothetical protein
MQCTSLCENEWLKYIPVTFNININTGQQRIVFTKLENVLHIKLTNADVYYYKQPIQ